VESDVTINVLGFPVTVIERMVKISLQISAQLENVTDLKAEGDDFRWYLKLKCTHCNEETPEFVYLTLAESHPLKGGRGSASLVVRCKLCGRDHSIDIIPESLQSYSIDDVPHVKTIVTFDCRGVEPTTFEPRMGWSVKGAESSTVFTNVDLTSLDWADYDEKSQQAVGIYELASRFVRI